MSMPQGSIAMTATIELVTPDVRAPLHSWSFAFLTRLSSPLAVTAETLQTRLLVPAARFSRPSHDGTSCTPTKKSRGTRDAGVPVTG
jgi:hypothetical protein